MATTVTSLIYSMVVFYAVCLVCKLDMFPEFVIAGNVVVICCVRVLRRSHQSKAPLVNRLYNIE